METLFFGCHGPFWLNLPSHPESFFIPVRKHYRPVYSRANGLQPNLELKEIEALTGRTYHRLAPRPGNEMDEVLARRFLLHRLFDGHNEIYVDELVDMPSSAEVFRLLREGP